MPEPIDKLNIRIIQPNLQFNPIPILGNRLIRQWEVNQRLKNRDYNDGPLSINQTSTDSNHVVNLLKEYDFAHRYDFAYPEGYQVIDMGDLENPHSATGISRNRKTGNLVSINPLGSSEVTVTAQAPEWMSQARDTASRLKRQADWSKRSSGALEEVYPEAVVTGLGRLGTKSLMEGIKALGKQSVNLFHNFGKALTPSTYLGTGVYSSPFGQGISLAGATADAAMLSGMGAESLNALKINGVNPKDLINATFTFVPLNSVSKANKFFKLIGQDFLIDKKLPTIYDLYKGSRRVLTAPKINILNYSGNTEGTFTPIYQNLNARDLKLKFEELVKLAEDPRSPYVYNPHNFSSYIYNLETGDIYRYSDHWGNLTNNRIWNYGNTGITHTRGEPLLARINIRDFKLNGEVLPIYEQDIANALEHLKDIPYIHVPLILNTQREYNEMANKISRIVARNFNFKFNWYRPGEDGYGWMRRFLSLLHKAGREDILKYLKANKFTREEPKYNEYLRR